MSLCARMRLFVCLCVCLCACGCVYMNTPLHRPTGWVDVSIPVFGGTASRNRVLQYRCLFPEGMYKTGAVCWKMAVSRGEGWSDSWHLAGEIWTRGGGDTRSFHGENEAASDFPCLSRNLPLWPAVYGRNMQAERKTVLPRGRKK